MFNNIKFTMISGADAAANYMGSYGELTFSWEDCLLRIHDGKTCGGKVVSPATPPVDISGLEAAVAALQAQNPLVDIALDGNGDFVGTYLDNTTEILDLPAFAAATDAAGLVTFDLNGTSFGPFPTGPHTVDTDTDTFATAVDNGDGTTTVTYADGTTVTSPNGPQVVDTDTVVTYDYVWATNGSVTITGSDGTTFTGPPNTVDTDTDTFAIITGNTITDAAGNTLTVEDPAFSKINQLGVVSTFDPATDRVLVDRAFRDTTGTIEEAGGKRVVLVQDGTTSWNVAYQELQEPKISTLGNNVVIALPQLKAGQDQNTDIVAVTATDVGTPVYQGVKATITLEKTTRIVFATQNDIVFSQDTAWVQTTIANAADDQVLLGLQLNIDNGAQIRNYVQGWRLTRESQRASHNTMSGNFTATLGAGTHEIELFMTVLEFGSNVNEMRIFQKEITWHYV